ncbi:type VI secretion system-associated protein TagF [Piscinibacter sakaiensis]|uniref:type VI secretion system-associated protein TagF n=1 Tax=Piscinibacter sakaiensis TaxID=1547922 RepID=UPI003AB0ADEF
MPIGLFGKLPSQGDFVSRRLPWEFTSVWDDWLQAGISSARSALGSSWNDAYLTAPLWRFQLAPGVIGSGAWIGFWFASVDRVGRQFPLALVEPLPPVRSKRYLLIEHDEAFFAVEDVALRGLDPRLGFDAFDRSFDGFSLLAEAAAAPAAVAQVVELQPAANERQSTGPAQQFATDADARTVLAAAEAAGPARCCFFTWGNEQHPPLLYRCDGLADASAFRGFIDGRWP